VVVATAGADPDLLALDLLAQGEHGPDSLLVAISPDAGLLGAIQAAVERGPEVPAERCVLVEARDAAAAVRLADAIAPEHLQLVGADAEALADGVRSAGALFVGIDAATAFGDYVAGSNHVLPTGGAARFGSALSVATFRRRMARVSLPAGAAARLAPRAAALARAEGFEIHAESMEERARA
jgi:histidinol dehydrogenase